MTDTVSREQHGWSVQPLRLNTVKLTNPKYPDVTLELRATDRDIRIMAHAGSEVVEETYVTRAYHELVVETVAGDQYRRVAIAPSKETIKTHVMLNKEHFEVEASPKDHGPKLLEELGKRSQVQTPMIGDFAQALKGNKDLRDQLKIHTEYGAPIFVRKVTSNGIVIGCALVCWLCSMGQWDMCVGCSICIEM